MHQIDSSTMGTHQLHLAWFTYNCCTESYTPPLVDLTNTNTSPINLYLVCKFQSFFSFWTACDIPNIEEDTKKQVARHNQPNIYIYIYKRQIDNKILKRSNIHDIGRNHEKMTQATTTTVLKIQLLNGLLRHYQQT